MRALESLRKVVLQRMGFMHGHRFRALWRVVCALIRGKQLWLTGLGRAMPTRARPKHAIKAVDRLLGNPRLYDERIRAIKAVDRLLGNPRLYDERIRVSAAVASLVVPENCQPVLLIDTMEIRQDIVALSAAVACEGRSIPVHSTVITKTRANNAECATFLDQLEELLPAGCRPILVTDGGFESNWFDAVASKGWDFVGRVRGQTKFLIENQWVNRFSLHERARMKAQSLGLVAFPQTKPRARRIILSAKPRCQHRQVATRRGPSRSSDYRYYRTNAHEPLVLATSLDATPSHVVRLYKTRMQIEQNFRDVKSHRWGWSLRHCGTKRPKRVELLLMIAALATVAQHLVGVIARDLGLQRRHQANTVRHRKVLSVFLLGGLALHNEQHGLQRISAPMARRAIETLRQAMARHAPLRAP